MENNLKSRNQMAKNYGYPVTKSTPHFDDSNTANIRTLFKTKQRSSSINSSKCNETFIKSSKRMKWIPNSTVYTENLDTNFSPITKRLCSLVNTKTYYGSVKGSQSFSNLTKNNSNYVEIFNKSKVVENIPRELENSSSLKIKKDLNHDKLRGFLRQLTVEKSGLVVENEITVIKPINETVKAHYEKKLKQKITEQPVTDNIIKKQPQSVIGKENCKTKTNVTTLKMEIQPNPSIKLERKIQSKTSLKPTEVPKIEINTSNSNGYLSNNIITKPKSDFRELLTPKSLGGSGGSSTDNNNTLNQIKTYSSDDKISLDKEQKSKRESFNRFNTIFHKFSKSRDKHKSNNNKYHSQSFRVCSNQKKYKTTSKDPLEIINNGDTMKMYDLPLQRASSELSVTDKDWQDDIDDEDSLPKPAENHAIKSKMKFSKKLFRIFSQTTYPRESKKSKMLQTCFQAIVTISYDSLINLITILSVELILSTIKSKSPLIKSTTKTDYKSKHKDSIARSISSKNGFSENTKFPRSNMASSKTSLISNTNSPKRVNISFDLNGRVIINNTERRDSRNRLGAYAQMGSTNSLYQHQQQQQQHQHEHSRIQSALRSKNSSTLSIPTRYQHDNNPRFQSTQQLSSAYRHSSNIDIPRSMPPRPQQSRTNRKPLNRGDEQSSIENIACLSMASKLKSNSNKTKLRPSSTNVTDMKQRFPANKPQPEVNDVGNYKFSVPIKSRLDFAQLDEVFCLKDEIYSKCDSSLLYIRSKTNASTTKFSKVTNKSCNDSWILYIESPTTEALAVSLKMVANKFPEWNIRTKIDAEQPCDNTHNREKVY